MHQKVVDLIAGCDDFDVDVTFNVAVVGSSCSGKSCLLQRFAKALTRASLEPLTALCFAAEPAQGSFNAELPGLHVAVAVM